MTLLTDSRPKSAIMQTLKTTKKSKRHKRTQDVSKWLIVLAYPDGLIRIDTLFVKKAII